MKRFSSLLFAILFCSFATAIFAAEKTGEFSIAAAVLQQQKTAQKATALSAGTGTLLSQSKEIDLACIQKAAGVRENAVIAAFEKKTSMMKGALDARRDAIQEGWGMGTVRERLQARNSAVKIFRKKIAEIQGVYRQEVRKAWNGFATAQKTCRVMKAEGQAGESEYTTNDGNL